MKNHLNHAYKRRKRKRKRQTTIKEDSQQKTLHGFLLYNFSPKAKKKNFFHILYRTICTYIPKGGVESYMYMYCMPQYWI